MIGFLTLIIALVASHGSVEATDQIMLAPSFSPKDSRYEYPYTVLQMAMEATKKTDGPFQIVYNSLKMKRKRALDTLIEGELINVHVAATRTEWEEKTIPVRIPVLKGLLGYRLLLVEAKELPRFKAIESIDDLRKLRAGAGQQWTTTLVLRDAGFNVVTGIDYEGLFGMLHMNRFDYFPRGINEIYPELEARKEAYPGLRIEPNLAIYFTTPSYFFVSPKNPELADRIERGMELLIRTGVLDDLFQEQYGEAIKRANLKNRKIFVIQNNYLSKETPLNRPELWYRP
jgi:hypothetical protein